MEMGGGVGRGGKSRGGARGVRSGEGGDKSVFQIIWRCLMPITCSHPAPLFASLTPSRPPGVSLVLQR